jgi:hypothetical protein
MGLRLLHLNVCHGRQLTSWHSQSSSVWSWVYRCMQSRRLCLLTAVYAAQQQTMGLIWMVLGAQLSLKRLWMLPRMCRWFYTR